MSELININKYLEDIEKELIRFEMEIDGVSLEIKEYLSFANKKSMIDCIIESVVIEENGILKVDYALKDFMVKYALINQYTNLDFSDIEDVMEIYDRMCKCKFVEWFVNKLNTEEYYFITSTINSEIKQIIEQQNSVGIQVAKVLNKLIDKIPDAKGLEELTKMVSESVSNFNPEKLQYVESFMKAINGDNNANATTESVAIPKANRATRRALKKE